MMVLEANAEVPKIEILTESLLLEEGRLMDRTDTNGKKAIHVYMTTEEQRRMKGLRCHYRKQRQSFV